MRKQHLCVLSCCVLCRPFTTRLLQARIRFMDAAVSENTATYAVWGYSLRSEARSLSTLSGLRSMRALPSETLKVFCVCERAECGFFDVAKILCL